ncbi:MAG: protease HtpX, partial [candidate division Zixibacteria bacterium]|nr:protease HtpX [candidate division Zixibacteria bacterium]
MNGFKVFLMMLALMGIFMWVGYAVGGRGGMVLAFVLASVMNFVSYWYSDKIVLRMYRARQISETDHRRLFQVVKRVTTQAMIPMPKV